MLMRYLSRARRSASGMRSDASLLRAFEVDLAELELDQLAGRASGPVNQVVAEAASQQLPATPATNSARISAARAMTRPAQRHLIIKSKKRIKPKEMSGYRAKPE